MNNFCCEVFPSVSEVIDSFVHFSDDKMDLLFSVFGDNGQNGYIHQYVVLTIETKPCVPPCPPPRIGAIRVG